MVIPVEMDKQSYDIVLERGALARVGELFELRRKVLIVTDTGVPAQYARAVAANCAQPYIVTIPAGEASKCFERLQELLSAMLDASFTRSDCLVAVGGGVVGDLSGFAASCYMRGLDFYNIPTTLLSQVDSSVGGKTAIDFRGVKNIVGAFWQPKKVLIDPDTLKTLDPRQLSAGLAETIKMAATCDKTLFSLFEVCVNLESELPEIIARSLAIKKNVVEQDPSEKGPRRVLNFGHTLGHAVESLNKGNLLHGECVALGMLPMCSDAARVRIAAVLDKYGLPTHIDDTTDALLPYIIHDKKMLSEGVAAVLVEEIGSFKFCTLPLEEIKKRLEATR